MKKTLILTLIAILLAAFGLMALAQGTPAAKAPAAEKKAAKVEKAYVCSMCDFAGDKPGKCPKCGMNLQEVNKSDVSYSCACTTKDGKPAKCCTEKSDKPGKCKCGVDMKMHVKGADKPAKS
jgi:hypothetical protein